MAHKSEEFVFWVVAAANKYQGIPNPIDFAALTMQGTLQKIIVTDMRACN